LSIDITARYRACRLVSASAEVTYVGNGDGNQGLISASYVPFGKHFETAAGAITPNVTVADVSMQTSVPTIKDYNDSYTGPLSKGASAFYKPVDANSFRYVYPLSSTQVRYPSWYIVSSPGLTGEVPLSTAFANASNGYGFFIFTLEGQDKTAGQVQFDVKINTNWESIPLDDDTDYVISASPTNSNAIDAGLGVASSTPSAGDNKTASERAAIAKLVV